MWCSTINARTRAAVARADDCKPKLYCGSDQPAQIIGGTFTPVPSCEFFDDLTGFQISLLVIDIKSFRDLDCKNVHG